MIATLSSFETQFEPLLVERGKSLFESGKTGKLKENDVNWQATISDGAKRYEVTVCIDEGIVTDIFCPCGPTICGHVIGVFYALKKKLKIETRKYDASLLEPSAAVKLGARLNDLIYASRMAGSKNGELEALGEGLKLKNDMDSLKAMVMKKQTYPHHNSRHPIMNGAKALLGAAILKYEEKEYEFVMNIARAVLTQLCREESGGNSAQECSRAAVELFNTLCIDPEVPAAMRKEVFGRVVLACQKKLYEWYHEELLSILTNPALEKDLQELALQELDNIEAAGEMYYKYLTEARRKLFEMTGRSEEQRKLLQENPGLYRDELVTEAMGKKDYETAKKLLISGVASDWHNAQKWKDLLFEIATIENDTAGIRAYHKDKYFTDGFAEDRYESCRSGYTNAEWLIEVENWIAILTGRSDAQKAVFALARIYMREKMQDRLIRLVQDKFSYELGIYAELDLMPEYTTELLACFRQWFLREAKYIPAQREYAIELRKKLMSVRKSGEGRKMVKDLVPELLAVHPTWKVYGEELGKLVKAS